MVIGVMAMVKIGAGDVVADVVEVEVEVENGEVRGPSKDKNKRNDRNNIQARANKNLVVQLLLRRLVSLSLFCDQVGWKGRS